MGSETNLAPHLNQNKGAARKGPLRAARYEDALVGVVAIVVAASLFWATFYFRAVNWTPLGLAFWPRIILGGLVATAIVLIVLRQLDTHSKLKILRPEIILFAAIASFVIALPILGFIPTGFIYTFTTIIWLDAGRKTGRLRAALLALAATALTYVVFGIGLNVWLPTGRVVDWMGF